MRAMETKSLHSFLTASEIAAKLGCSRISIYRLVQRELLPSDPNSRHLKIPVWAFDAYVAASGNLQPLWWTKPGRKLG